MKRKHPVIPDFDEHGNLPDGVYPCDPSVLEAQFVRPFTDSKTRTRIHDGFMLLRSEAEGSGWREPSGRWVLCDPQAGPGRCGRRNVLRPR